MALGILRAPKAEGKGAQNRISWQGGRGGMGKGTSRDQQRPVVWKHQIPMQGDILTCVVLLPTMAKVS